jgi:hypothetical protein
LLKEGLECTIYKLQNAGATKDMIGDLVPALADTIDAAS